ncbi:MAG: glycerate kinase [Bacteroidetes bacterium]|nr:MAG: glycerate kinase [Bacteroidota bacterium]
MHILISPNAFKNSLDARSASAAIAEGLLESKLACSCQRFPVGDGGDGTAKLLLEAFKGNSIPVYAHDPLGRLIQSSIGIAQDGTVGFIEMADASGLRLLRPDEYDPLHATSYGTGELLLELLNRGVRKIIMGVGGSATIDGGVGILQALGFSFLNSRKEPLTQIPLSLTELSFIDIGKADPRLQDNSLIVLCDVQNKLLGPHGAAAVFGPQKGARPNDISILEKGLSRLRDLGIALAGRDMSILESGGAAGGIAAGLSVFLNADLANGIEYFLMITDFDQALSEADLVITGEGSIDEQTLQGKAPMGVARWSKNRGVPVIALGGSIPSPENQLFKRYFDLIISINPEGTSMTDALQQTAANLKKAAKKLGDALASGEIQF